jgi:hypothetical protein
VDERICGVDKDDKVGADADFRLRNVTLVTHLLIADVNSCRKQFGDMVLETLNIDYVQLTFREYCSLLSGHARHLPGTKHSTTPE